MHEVDRHGAFPDRGGDTFHRVEPYVAGGEDVRNTRLERKRRACQGPAPPGVVGQQIEASDDEPVTEGWAQVGEQEMSPALGGSIP